ncbi:MAG: hypothetical protein BECKG1743E_GA0114224_101641, partial [Candidatus Kentron sp. G]
MPKNCGSTALCYTHSADQPGIQQEPEHFERLSLTILGARQEIIYPNREVFCSASRRNDKRIVNCVTVIATQKLDDKDKQVGIFFELYAKVICVAITVTSFTMRLPRALNPNENPAQ